MFADEVQPSAVQEHVADEGEGRRQPLVPLGKDGDAADHGGNGAEAEHPGLAHRPERAVLERHEDEHVQRHQPPGDVGAAHMLQGIGVGKRNEHHTVPGTRPPPAAVLSRGDELRAFSRGVDTAQREENALAQ